MLSVVLRLSVLLCVCFVVVCVLFFIAGIVDDDGVDVLGVGVVGVVFDCVSCGGVVVVGGGCQR